MADNEKGFTFTWEIENFSMLPHQCPEYLKSNTFVVDNIEWNILLFPRGMKEEGYISLCLNRTSNDPELKITVLFTIVSTEPSSEKSCLIEDPKLSISYLFYVSLNVMSLSDIYAQTELYLPNDMLTIRCSLKPADIRPKEINLPNKLQHMPQILKNCCLRTGVHVNRRCIALPIRNIQELVQLPDKASFVLETALTESSSLKITFNFTKLANNGFAKIEICQTSLPFKAKRNFVKCRMTVISARKEYQHSAESAHLFQLSLDDIWNFPDFLITSNLTQDKYLYLDDTLLLQCELAYSCKSAVYHVENNYTPLTFEAKEVRSVGELVNKLGKLYFNEKLCDVELRAGGKTIPAHKNVLCAMSPVFEAMFENDLKEKDSNVVEIKDVDPDTLRRMLASMYSDTLMKDLSFENATKLFSAADKYDIVTLRRRCSILLVSALSVANVCDVLVLADAHQDNFLLTAVHNFISNHAKDTFNSEHWKRFMDLDPKLSGKIMHHMLVKKQHV